MVKYRKYLYFFLSLLVVVFVVWYLTRPIISATNEGSMTFKIYFNNNKYDPTSADCRTVFAVKRISSNQSFGPEREALTSLLDGPTTSESKSGYISSINLGVKIQKFEISGGIASVDFDETLERAVGGSCRVANIVAQINSTLEQFGTIKKIIISIDGRTEGIFQL